MKSNICYFNQYTLSYVGQNGKHVMKTEFILGRPGAGKTARLIACLNSSLGFPILISLENPPALLRERGLKDTVELYSPDKPKLLTIEDIVDESRKVKATIVAIENLQLLPMQIELCALIEALEEVGVEHFFLSSHLRRDGVCASKDRIDAIRDKCIVHIA